MRQISNNYVFKILKLFYGELTHKENTFNQKLMRIISRTPLRFLIFRFYNYFNKNRKNKVYDENIFENIVSVEKSIIDLNSEGICQNLVIKKNLIDVINEESDKKFFKVNRTSNFIKISEKKDGDGIYIARLLNPHLEIEEINKIIFNKDIINIVKSYLKCEPIFLSSQIWWSFPYYDHNNKHTNPPNNEFGFHYDVDDFRFLKFFIYLSDVSDLNGPHVYIKNSGKKTLNEYLDRRITDEEAQTRYKHRIINLTGKSGTSFIEDTSFYHKGTNPLIKNGRCILQILYVSKKW